MRRSILIILLSLGVIAGYASAFAGWRFGGHGYHRHGYWDERHWARVCAEAAREAGPGAPSRSDAPSPEPR
jgi:hypothetical protein